MEKNNINCIKCKYFFITWDKSFPNGCKLFGFKGMKLPSFTVLQATGAACTNFLEKQK
jgi:hypothetical protein